MNKDAGRGNWLVVTIRLKNGKDVPMVVDTGSPVTCFDTNWETTLGKCLTNTTFWNFGKGHKISIYAAPNLYLGSTLLKTTDTNVVGDNFNTLSSDAGRPIQGILGMDVLEHYCIQLDFKRGKVRFLDDDRANVEGWGKPFALTDIGDGCFAISKNLVGAKGSASLIDTGYDYDGWLTHEMFQQWTNHTTLLPAKGEARSPNGVLDGEIYHELNLRELEKAPDTNDSHMRFNGIGLHVLSENLVTFDFPKKTMYLKRTNKWPLYDKTLVSVAKLEIRPALELLKRLKKTGQLPGWSKTDRSSKADQRAHFQYHHHFLDVVTFDLRKKGDSSIYHYTLNRTSEEKAPAVLCPRQAGNPLHQIAGEFQASFWKLQKAWRTDQNGGMIDQYPIPQTPQPR